MSKNSLVLEILAFVVFTIVCFCVPFGLAWNDALAITPSSDPFFAGNVIFGLTVYFGVGLVLVGGVAAVVVTAKEMTCPKWMVAPILAITPNLTKITTKANTANDKENAMPLFIATIITLVILIALVLFPVSAFAATITPEPVMTIEITHLKLIWFFACTFAALAFVKEFMLNRKIKALTAELKIANRRADRAEAQLEEANACLSTSTATADIMKLQADNAQLVAQTTWLSTLANNLSKIVAGVATTLVCLFVAMPAHAAAPWQFAADAGQLPDMIACACLAGMVFAGVTALVLVADLLIRKAILAITNIYTSANTAITLESAMPVITLAFIALIGLILALFPSCANAATSVTMDNNGLTINVCNNVVLSYLAFVLGSAGVAIIGAILCEVIVRHTRTIAKFLGLVALVMIPSVADAASLTATATNTYAIVGILVGILGLFFIGALTVTRHEIAAGIIAAFSVFAIFPVGIVGTEMGIDKTILINVITGILIWVMLAFGVLQICMMPGRKADKAAALAKKEEWNMIIRKADEKRENARLDAWYDRAEYADSLNQLSRDARVAVLRGKPYWTNQSVMSAADKACGYRRAVLTR